MDIVFVHGNYPAQFRHLAPTLANIKEHSVFYITAREDIDSGYDNNIRILKYAQHRNPSGETHHYLTTTEESILKGQAVLREIDGLIKEGVNPKIVITHGGMGLGLFIKEIVPKAIHISLFEWYFQEETTKNLIRNYDLNERMRTRFRNLPIIDELMRCDIGVVPTEWQKKQFPAVFQNKLRVIFDGIDLNFFRSNDNIDREDVNIKGENNIEIKIKPNDKVISYATRGMETLRGFPEFINIAARCLKKNPNLLVIIAGRDKCAYSYQADTHEGSWKNKMMEEIGEFRGKENIIFTGLLNYSNYRSLLQRSNLHFYFTRPYVTSWSLFEAAACGSRLCVSEGDATKDIIENTKEMIWVDIEDIREKEQAIEEAISNNINRAKLKPQYELGLCIRQWIDLINEAIFEKTK